MAYGNGNGFARPPEPPVQPPPLLPPRVDSVYNVITRRIRAAKTIFGDNVKLVLRQTDSEHWSKLPKPYLLVVPQQVRSPREVDVDTMSFVNPRVVTFVAQFDGRGSEAEYLAANDIDTAEMQLIFVLAKWRPDDISYRPTEYAGMRIVGTREPDVKVVYSFTFNEEVVLRDEPPIFDEPEPEELELEGIHVHLNDACCEGCIPEPIGPPFTVSGGGCRADPPPPDPCAPPECPPILGANDNATARTK